MKSWKRWLVCALAGLACMPKALADGLLCVSLEGCAALVSAQGQEIIAPGEWDDLFKLADKLYALGVETQEGMRYALFSAEGGLLTDAAYEMLSASGDAVLFRQGGLYGAMDRQGNVLVEPLYTQLTAAGDGFLAMTENPFDEDADEIFRLTAEGELLSTGVSSDEGLYSISDDRMPFQSPGNERFGYIDAQGRVVIEAQLETAGRFVDGIARASMDGLLGVIDPDGQWLIAPEYEYLEIGDGVIVGLSGRERMDVFNMECEVLFCVEGAKLDAAVAGGYPVLRTDGVTRVYTAQGDILFETDASAAVTAGLNGQLIVSDGDWGAKCVSLVSADGVRAERADQHLIALADGRYAFIKMNVAAYYSEALDEVRYSCDYDSMRWGMIDSAGNEILPAVYTEIRALGEDCFLAAADDGLRVVDANGNVIWAKIEGE